MARGPAEDWAVGEGVLNQLGQGIRDWAKESRDWARGSRGTRPIGGEPGQEQGTRLERLGLGEQEDRDQGFRRTKEREGGGMGPAEQADWAKWSGGLG